MAADDTTTAAVHDIMLVDCVRATAEVCNKQGAAVAAHSDAV
jgi:hypothetical protein